MSRERIEDLGRIAVIIDKILDSEMFTIEYIIDGEASDKERMLKQIISDTEEIHKELIEIRDIAYGLDSYNSKNDDY